MVTRDRLTSHLAATRNKRVALVLGQAAQGKSTLAAAYVVTISAPFAWINLDGGDADPANLYLWLARSVESAWPDLDLSRVMSIPGTTMGPRAPAPMYREWASALLTSIPGPMELVLDGLDRLNGGPSFELLQMLVDETPSDIRWLMLSRSRPPLETERWEMNRLAVTIPNEDLAFTADEIRILGRELYQYDFSPDQIAALFHFTEGWVGGLMVILESLSAHERLQDGLDRLLRGTEGPKGRIFQYLAEQVFDRLPSHLQEFLTVTSLLDSLDAQVAEALTGQTAASGILHDLVNRNFFVAGHLGPGLGQRYRYHQLFREFLQTRFETAYPLGAQVQWKRQAAALYRARKEPEQALQLYVSVGAWDEAAGILRHLGLELLQSGRMGDLTRWINALPEAMVRDDPWLTTHLCSTRRYTAAGKNLPEMTRAADQFQQQGDLQGRLMALAFLVEAQNIIGHYVPETLKACLDLLDSIKTDDYPFERGYLWHQLGFYVTLHGDFHLAYDACLNACIIARQIKNDTLLANALVNTVTIVAFLGKFKELDEIRRELDRLLDQTESREVKGLYLVADSLATVFTGHAGHAVTKIEACLKYIESYGLYYLFPPATLYHVICLAYNEQIEAATQAAIQAVQFAKKLDNLFMETVNHLFWGIALYRVGRFADAEPHLRKALAALTSGRVQAPYHEAAGIQVLNLALMSQGEPPDMAAMERAHDRFLNSGSPLLAADSSLAMALVWRAAGDAEKADTHLVKGFTLTAQYGYDFFMFLSYNDVARAGTQALISGVKMKNVQPEVTRLLTGRCADAAPRHLHLLLKHEQTSVREAARNLLLNIRRQSLPTIRIETLGGLTAFRGDVPITEEEWGGAMPKDLLKAIISLGPRRVTRDLVIHALWPETTPKAAANNFKIALHRLRHVLEPDLDSALGSAYILLKENMITLTDAVAEIDLEGLDRLARAARSMDRKKPIKAIAAYSEAVNAYGGSYLAEDLYADWIVKRRSRFQNLFQDLVMEKAGLHETLGHFRKAGDCYRRVLALDPINEEAARHLMTLLAAHGRQNEALKVFNQLQMSLKREMGVGPEKMTQMVYEKILES